MRREKRSRHRQMVSGTSHDLSQLGGGGTVTTEPTSGGLVSGLYRRDGLHLSRWDRHLASCSGGKASLGALSAGGHPCDPDDHRRGIGVACH